MRRSSLTALACPNCTGPLDLPGTQDDPVLDSVLLCKSEDLTFPVEAGVPMLVRPGSIGRVEAFESSFARAWMLEGWGARDDAYLLGLPGRDSTGRRTREWRVKARSMEALFELFGKPGPNRVVDLGCGTGWLAHHIARRGCDVYAVDIVRSDAIGLSAAGAFLRHGPSFERIWGELNHTPLKTSFMDAVICNASLHYVSDLSGTLQEVARVLRPGGLFVVMNSPVHEDPVSASRAEREFRTRLRRNGATEDVASSYHHFVRSRLQESIRSAFESVHEAPFDPGRRFLLGRRMKGVALGMELASFPILYATKARGDGSARERRVCRPSAPSRTGKLLNA